MNDKKLKDMWNNTENLQNVSGYESDKIERFISGRSISVADKIRKMVQFDIILKLLVALTLVIDIFIYFNVQMNVALVCVISFAGLLPLVFFEYRMLLMFNKVADYNKSTKEKLSSMLTFLKTRFFASILAMASTYVFLFLAGSLLYFYVEYGQLRPLDGTDIFVFSVFLLVGVALNFVVNFNQVQYYIKHLEWCLKDLNHGVLEMVSENIEQQRKKDRAINILLAFAFIFGFVVFIAVLTNFGILK